MIVTKQGGADNQRDQALSSAILQLERAQKLLDRLSHGIGRNASTADFIVSDAFYNDAQFRSRLMS